MYKDNRKIILEIILLLVVSICCFINILTFYELLIIIIFTLSFSRIIEQLTKIIRHLEYILRPPLHYNCRHSVEFGSEEDGRF